MSYRRRASLHAALIFLRAAPAAAQIAAPPMEVVVEDERPQKPATPENRAASRVTRQELDERLPRSTPDALRFEPGTFVQQTAHGQASVYIRGRTGQQIVLAFDGIRLNNSTYRQGPNQYLFTIDQRTIKAIDVLRGGASTRYGSDAVGGVVVAHPREPTLTLGATRPVLKPQAWLRMATADGDVGNRLELDVQVTERLRALVGVGMRRVGLLEGGGPVLGVGDGLPAKVPAFAPDGRTQLGTGFRELTADGRVRFTISPKSRLVGAVYIYRQLDAPRTDQCPPYEAPITECHVYDEQFHTMAYLAGDADLGIAARKSRLVLVYKRQHERRTTDRPTSFIQNLYRDNVTTVGVTAHVETDDLPLGTKARAKLEYGGDAYYDWIDSAAWMRFTDVDMLIDMPRGQYIAGSRYLQGGLHAEGRVTLWEKLVARAGVRGGGARASSPADPSSDTKEVENGYGLFAALGSLEVKPHPVIALIANVDRSVRAPNLDDLTSRQQTGSGFQLENAGLDAETATTLEGGARVTSKWIDGEVWGYRSILHKAITRVFTKDCPASTPQCNSSRWHTQLVNAEGGSIIDGIEVIVNARFPCSFAARATVAYAYGEGPNPQAPPTDPGLPYEARVPISRIPPFNGTLSARWDSPIGVSAGATLRWAAAQTRLAPTDTKDVRIPTGGTPGFAVLDLRAGYHLGRELTLGVLLENVLDAAYRYHGSSINGPGRGILFNVQAGR